MDKLAERLKAYIESHPIDLGDSDCLLCFLGLNKEHGKPNHTGKEDEHNRRNMNIQERANDHCNAGSGIALETIILASSVLYELVGPGCAKLSLYLSKSYSTKLEEIVPLEETTEDTRPNTVEQLIERIQIIQQELKAETESAEERAFTEAAQTHIEAMSLQHARFLSGGRRK